MCNFEGFYAFDKNNETLVVVFTRNLVVQIVVILKTQTTALGLIFILTNIEYLVNENSQDYGNFTKTY